MLIGRFLTDEILSGRVLSTIEAESFAEQLAVEEIPPEKVGAALAVMNVRGVSTSEISGFAQYALRNFDRNPDLDVVDVCGTGGDGSGSFNISTAAGIGLSSMGIAVAKHGNRAVSSKCGSADVLEKLGLCIELNDKEVRESISRNKFGFLFAPLYHSAFSKVAPVRKALGIKTIFNLLGPIVNPLRPQKQVLGLFDRSFIAPVAESLNAIGVEEALVVSTQSGFDEFSTAEVSHYAHLREGHIELRSFDPSCLNLPYKSKEINDGIRGGDSEFNARLIERIFSADEKGPATDVVALNMGAVLCLLGRSQSIEEGFFTAKAHLLSGRCLNHLKNLREFYHVG